MSTAQLLALFSITLLFSLSLCQCPHDDDSLLLWSEQSGWSDPDSDVVINGSTRVLFDVTEPVSINSINVTGELIFDNIVCNLQTCFFQ